MSRTKSNCFRMNVRQFSWIALTSFRSVCCLLSLSPYGPKHLLLSKLKAFNILLDSQTKSFRHVDFIS